MCLLTPLNEKEDCDLEVPEPSRIGKRKAHPNAYEAIRVGNRMMISQDIVNAWNLMKANAGGALLLILDDAKHLILQSESGRETAYSDIIAQLPEDDVALLGIWFDYESKEKVAVKLSKILLINWQPETAPARRRFANIANMEELKNIVLSHKTLTVSSLDELDHETIIKLLVQ